MLLTLDLGNSAVKGGLFDGDELVRVFSVGAPAEAAEDASPLHWEEVLAPHLDDVAVERIGLVSVVPSRTEAVTSALEVLAEASIATVHPEMPLPFTLGYDTPHTLGADRLAAAAAGWVLFGRDGPQSVLVVDAGTAVNYEVIHRDGVYQGGAIGVGPALAQQALHTGTAQLPDAPLSLPDAPVGHSTRTALQSGIMGGFVESVRGMRTRLAQSLPDAPLLVLTGGWGDLLADALDRVDHHEPHLVLQGVRVLTTLND